MGLRKNCPLNVKQKASILQLINQKQFIHQDKEGLLLKALTSEESQRILNNAYLAPQANGYMAGFQTGMDLLRSKSLLNGHRDYGGLYIVYGC